MVPPKQSRTSFGAFQPRPASLVEVVDRGKYAGLQSVHAAKQLMDDYAAMRGIAASTKKEKTAIMRRILGDLAEKGVGVADVRRDDLAAYRAYLAQQVEAGAIKENYASNLVKDWNALVSLLFGEKSRPGEGLKMKGFPQTPKLVVHLEMQDIEAMLDALPNRRFQNQHFRRLAGIYIELATASAGRWDSISAETLTFADIDFVAGTVRFRQVKNTEEHTAVLTERCLRELRGHEAFLRGTSHWKGQATPVLMGPRGKMPTYQWLERSLKGLAALAGIRTPVTTHLFRKSVGTHMARQNPRLAREQLGITEKVFERHYNQPTVKDRVERRDLLLGSDPSTREKDARIGALHRQVRKGEISQQEFDRELSRSLLAEATTPRRDDIDPAFA